MNDLDELRLSRDNAVEFSRQMVAQNEDLKTQMAAFKAHKCFGFCGACRENLEQITTLLTRLSEAEAENARLTRAVAFEKANTQESSDNGARWRWQYEQEVARRDEAIRKREEAEKSVAVLQESLEDWVRRHGIQAKKAEEAERALETERMRLAACGVAAMANTPGTASERIGPENPYYSASYGDVCRAVDGGIALRQALEEINALSWSEIDNGSGPIDATPKERGLFFYVGRVASIAKDALAIPAQEKQEKI